ncbi:hypothetical protein [Herbaspirillum lusitanum]|nr:hypothetical protein [Herbaspirillum lusitanum]
MKSPEVFGTAADSGKPGNQAAEQAANQAAIQGMDEGQMELGRQTSS